MSRKKTKYFLTNGKTKTESQMKQQKPKKAQVFEDGNESPLSSKQGQVESKEKMEKPCEVKMELVRMATPYDDLKFVKIPTKYYFKGRRFYPR